MKRLTEMDQLVILVDNLIARGEDQGISNVGSRGMSELDAEIYTYVFDRLNAGAPGYTARAFRVNHAFEKDQECMNR